MAIDRLSGGLTPADGSDPRTFPTIFNDAADEIERVDDDLTALDGRVTTTEGDITAVTGRVDTAEGDITQLQSDVSENVNEIQVNKVAIEINAVSVQNLEDSLDVLSSTGFRLVGTRFYVADGTFVKADPFGDASFDGDDLRAIRVRMVGGGGGGGGCATTGGGQIAIGRSGFGGGFSESLLTDISGLAASVNVTVGGGGSGGAAGVNAGTDGGDSSFGTLVVASGGEAGSGSGALAAPQIFTQGDFVGTNTGQLTVVNDSPMLPQAFSAAVLETPRSGGSVFGVQQKGLRTVGGVDGTDAAGTGSGGTGGGNTQNQSTTRSGGAGADGIVIVEVFA